MHVLQLPEKRLEGGKEWKKGDFHGGMQRRGKLTPFDVSAIMRSQLAWTKPRETPSGESVHVRQEWTSLRGLQQDSLLVAHGGNWLRNTPLSGCLPFPVSPPHSLTGAFLNPLLNKHSHPYLTVSFWENTNEGSTTE